MFARGVFGFPVCPAIRRLFPKPLALRGAELPLESEKLIFGPLALWCLCPHQCTQDILLKYNVVQVEILALGG